MARRRASSERDADTALRRRTCWIAGHGGGGRTAATATVVVPDRTAHPEIRVGQADRERVVGRLCAAVGEGRLTLDEAADRQAAAYAARFPRDLAPLLVDLPTAPPDRDVDVVHVNGAPRTHLRQALRTILMINCIALCVGLSAFPVTRKARHRAFRDCLAEQWLAGDTNEKCRGKNPGREMDGPHEYSA